jgi:hypothetical protein
MPTYGNKPGSGGGHNSNSRSQVPAALRGCRRGWWLAGGSTTAPAAALAPSASAGAAALAVGEVSEVLDCSARRRTAARDVSTGCSTKCLKGGELTSSKKR